MLPKPRSTALWEIRATAFSPSGKYKVRVWQGWDQRPDSDSIQAVQDFLIEKVQDYCYGGNPIDPVSLAGWLVAKHDFHTVEVTEVNEECGVTFYSQWP